MECKLVDSGWVRRGALLNKGFGLCADRWFGWEADGPCIQHDLVSQQLRLRAAVTKGPPPKQHLVQDDAQRPNVHLPGRTLCQCLLEAAAWRPGYFR